MTVNLAIWIGIDYDAGLAGCTHQASPVDVTVALNQHSQLVQIMGEPSEYEALAAMLMTAARLKREHDKNLSQKDAAE